jgi:hypothetical protein
MTANTRFDRIDGIISYTLMRGCDDWVQACELVDNIFNLEPVFEKFVASDVLGEIFSARHKGGKDQFELAYGLSIAIIEQVLRMGYMEIGYCQKGFHPWNCSIEESLLRVKHEWDDLNGALPGPGIFWLCNTKLGNEIGRKALSLWRSNISDDSSRGSDPVP